MQVSKSFRLCLASKKKNYKGKIEEKKKINKKNKKIDQKLINYFYFLFQTYFTYFNLSI